MSSFKNIEKEIIDGISKITGNDEFNVNLYKNMFKNMNDKEFTLFMEKLKDGDILNIIVDTDISKNKISVKNSIKVCKELGYNMFQKITTSNISTLPVSESTYENFIQILPFRRAKQTSDKGVSVGLDSKHIDILTGQPSGVSASSKISNPETQILLGLGLENVAKEFNVDRSDSSRTNLLISSIKKYGTIPDGVLDQYGEQTRTTQTLKAYLNAMHLKMNL